MEQQQQQQQSDDDEQLLLQELAHLQAQEQQALQLHGEAARQQALQRARDARAAWLQRVWGWLTARGKLGPDGHWWCQHGDITAALAEVLRFWDPGNNTVKAVWSCMSSQLTSCFQCIEAYIQFQVRRAVHAEPSNSSLRWRTQGRGQGMHTAGLRPSLSSWPG